MQSLQTLSTPVINPLYDAAINHAKEMIKMSIDIVVDDNVLPMDVVRLTDTFEYVIDFLNSFWFKRLTDQWIEITIDDTCTVVFYYNGSVRNVDRIGFKPANTKCSVRMISSIFTATNRREIYNSLLDIYKK